MDGNNNNNAKKDNADNTENQNINNINGDTDFQDEDGKEFQEVEEINDATDFLDEDGQESTEVQEIPEYQEPPEEPVELAPVVIDESVMPEVATTQEIADAEYFVPAEEQRRVAEMLFDWIEIFASAFLTVILLFTFILRLVTVDGSSMVETLHDKDNLIISHLFYTPKQGDIVVLQVPDPQYKTPLIKRVIATEGQTIRFDFANWIIYVDDVPLDEPYVNREYKADGSLKEMDTSQYLNHLYAKYGNPPVITVEKGKIFVMGDNRNHSSDSRVESIDQVDVRNVVGRVLIRVFPFNKFGVVKPNES